MTDLTRGLRGQGVSGPWFVLGEVCKVLEIKGSISDVKKRLDQLSVDTIDLENTRGQMRQTTIVNKANMYRVIMRSDKAEAVKFR